ncbi:MAG: hypothetical protein D8M54_15725 [Chloroflexi bacterium]|nr:hypothetical protein [Chloroflexota bacterium]
MLILAETQVDAFEGLNHNLATFFYANTIPNPKSYLSVLQGANLMQKRLWWLLNGAIVAGTILFLLFQFANVPRSNALFPNGNLPGSALA